VLPYRQLCPAYPYADHRRALLRRSSSPRDRAKGSAGTFQRGKFPDGYFTHRKRISQKLYRKFAPQLCGTNGTQQAWMNSRNSSTIASDWKHRQPIFLHPIDETGAIRQSRAATTLSCPALLNPYSSLYTLGFPSIKRFAHRDTIMRRREVHGKVASRFVGVVIVSGVFILVLARVRRHKPPGPNPFPVRISLNPTTSASLQPEPPCSSRHRAEQLKRKHFAGVTFAPAILESSTLLPTDFACAGTWNAPLYTVCTPAGLVWSGDGLGLRPLPVRRPDFCSSAHR